MLTQFLNLLATIISVISLLIVTYGALIAIISFIINVRHLPAIGVGVPYRFGHIENGIGTYNERTDYSGRYCRRKNHIIGVPQQRNQRIRNRK